MWKTSEGSTGRLIQLCLAYFVFYVITGVTVRYFQFGPPGMKGMEFLVYSTAGGSLIAMSVVIALRWYRLSSNRLIQVAGLQVPSEYVYIIPSGICTAVVIPTTTLMYSLPITVMVAMTLMRGSVILISLAVDLIQIRQGILHKRLYRIEIVAALFALGAVGVNVYYGSQRDGGFDFLHNRAAMVIFQSYIAAYAVRIYLMNYFKNTRAPGVQLDNKGFFAVEQIAATVTLIAVATVVFYAPSWFGATGERVTLVHDAIASPRPLWQWAVLAGMAFGMVAFFSVFIFMFKGRTATFAGLVNRLTSLIAGTVATLVYWLGFGGKAVESQDWIALIFIFAAIACLSVAERRRRAELRATPA